MDELQLRRSRMLHVRCRRKVALLILVPEVSRLRGVWADDNAAPVSHGRSSRLPPLCFEVNAQSGPGPLPSWPVFPALQAKRPFPEDANPSAAEHPLRSPCAVGSEHLPRSIHSWTMDRDPGNTRSQGWHEGVWRQFWLRVQGFSHRHPGEGTHQGWLGVPRSRYRSHNPSQGFIFFWTAILVNIQGALMEGCLVDTMAMTFAGLPRQATTGGAKRRAKETKRTKVPFDV